MATTVVACPQCGRRYRAPAANPDTLIECPWCGAHDRRGALRQAEAAASSGPAPRRSTAWSLVAAVLACAGLGTLAYTLKSWLPRPAATLSNPSPGLSQPPLTPELRQARETAAQALGSAEWSSALTWIRDAERVRPLMAHYHLRHPWVPLPLADTGHGRTSTTTAGTRWAHLSLQSDRGAPLSLHLELTASGWKLDWERLVQFREFAWKEFHASTEENPMLLEILALRGSASDSHFAASGLTPDSGLAVRLDGPKPGQPALAIVPKASDLGRLFHRELTWEHPRPYRCSLKLIAPHLTPPLAEITDFAGSGWLDHAP
ncbi:MAG: hypothetical protein ACKV19_11010 [Verrucomicrobiales bacterium]